MRKETRHSGTGKGYWALVGWVIIVGCLILMVGNVGG